MIENKKITIKEGEKLNKVTLKQLFVKSDDVLIQEYEFNKQRVMFITCDALINQQLLFDTVISAVKEFLNEYNGERVEKSISNNLYIPSLTKLSQLEEVIDAVYSGKVVLLFEMENIVFSSDIAKIPNRQPEETKTEIPIKGPRDNFIEDVATNIALVRKRLPTNSLCVKKFRVGKRTKTTVAVLYFDDIVNKDILNGIKRKIRDIDIDIIFSGEELMEFIDKRTYLFPRHDYTGRPDFAVQSLVLGRVFILIDGVAYGIVTPVNMFLLLKSGEDNEYPSFFSSFERLLRLFSIIVGMLLPAFWLALTTFHQNQLPLQLLATIVQASTGLPLPAAVEMLIMLIMFELFREAGLRLPEAIGGTLSVVGGLIIGDAAIRAGITSPAMVVIIAISIISTFTLLNQSLVTSIALIRGFSILFTSILGLFGFFMSLFFVVLYVSHIRVFGVPYLSLATDLTWSTLKKTIFRETQKAYRYRPSSLKPIDKTRQKG